MNYSAAATKKNNNDLTTSPTGNIHELENDQQQQFSAAERFKSAQRLLIRELKRKVDFTEKMNWLCKLNKASSEIKATTGCRSFRV